MAAAVADYRPAEEATQKIKKSAGDLSLRLTRNDDILALVGQQRQEQGWPKCVVGFAAETENLLDNASEKLKRKNLDFIIANDVSRTDAGFGVDTNAVTILKRQGEAEDLPLQSKRSIAEAILDRVQAQLKDA
jgi:phosphopantothenoylcysteine decarboxylase/phosphopantothenate--cysteine ligase